ncbi:MAG TPA: ABC transporter permease [Methylomirabilota bacterium]|jgi:spermidine/putrescine transport system permease protein|nr:ABC transporter permease [Methylomirabilota bacterium]
MATLVTTAPRAARLPGMRRRASNWALPAFTMLAIGYLLIPIAVMILFSFNDYNGKFNFIWNGFTLNAWLHPLAWPGLPEALGTSLRVAVISTLASTLLGTLIALALTRYRFRGRGFVNGLIFLPMATPEIVLGSSLLTLFVNTALQNGVLPPGLQQLPRGTLYPLGFNTILIAHIMFNISYVVVTVRARISGFDRRLEEAAMDLGANEWTTFWKVTFPLIFPGILAAALLAFSLSIDDFVITNFVSGTTNTFPIWVWGIQKNALPAQVNVIGSIVFLSAVGLVALSTIRTGRVPR